MPCVNAVLEIQIYSLSLKCLLGLWLLRDGVSLLVHQTLLAHDAEGLVDGVQLGTGLSVGVEVVVGPGEVLAVVDGEVHVVQRVVRGAVDELLGPVTRDHVSVVDEDGPDLHQDEHDQVEVPLHGADEDKDVVRQRLDEAVGRVESQSSKGRRHDPLVVRLVDVLVDAGVVLQAVNPVDADVVEGHVQHGRAHQPAPAILGEVAVQQAVTPHLGEEDGQGHEVDEGDGLHGGDDLLAHLVLEEAWVVFQAAVKDEVVREGREDPVQHGGAELGKDENRDDLAIDVVARPC